MANVHNPVAGFTRADALKRVPTSINADVGKEVAKLHELGVKAAPNEYKKSLVKDNLRLVLKDRLGVGKDHLGVSDDNKGAAAKAIVKNISPNLRGPVLNRVEKRLAALTDGQIRGMTRLLREQKLVEETGTTRSIPERMLIRSSLLLAFANGSNTNEMERLKTFLSNADTQTRKDVYQALNTANPNVTSVLDTFQNGPLQIFHDDAKTLTEWATRDGGAAGSQAAKRVDDYMAAWQKATGRAVSDPEYTITKIGAAAVSAYTSEVYKTVNEEMRAHPGANDKLSPESELLSRAATHFLSTLPDFRGIVSRGGGSGWQDDAIKKYVPGQIVTEYTLLSSSADKGFGGSIQFLIESHHGKEVSDLSVAPKDGREVMFPPGTRFEVLGVHHATEDTSMDNAGQWIQNEDGKQTLVIVMREVG